MKNRKLIPYEVILAAKHGTPDAMRQILLHYDRYINSCSQRVLFDEYGNQFAFLDEEIKNRIQAKLMYQIIYDFDPYRLPDGETVEKCVSN